jgi:hypothetical protein
MSPNAAQDQSMSASKTALEDLVVVRFNAASPFGAMVGTGVFDARNLRKADRGAC